MRGNPERLLISTGPVCLLKLEMLPTGSSSV
jgi:hypothetical protein